jgi:Glycosyltransferases, probably involved in cell wall biogenesis
LDSIVNQSYKDYEVIIVNDGTKDNSVEIINKYLKKYDNFKLFNKENGGVSSARNYGLEKATGEYVIFIDPDDLITNNFFDKLITMTNINHSDISISNYQFI